MSIQTFVGSSETITINFRSIAAGSETVAQSVLLQTVLGDPVKRVTVRIGVGPVEEPALLVFTMRDAAWEDTTIFGSPAKPEAVGA